MRMAMEELTPGMILRIELRWVVWWEGVRSERTVFRVTKLSTTSRVWCEVGVSSRARHAARFSPVLFEEGGVTNVWWEEGRNSEVGSHGMV